jgi:hypothetical protein
MARKRFSEEDILGLLRQIELAFGIFCLSYVSDLLEIWADPLTSLGQIRQTILNGIVFAIFLVSYVVNIGFSQSWNKWPAAFSTVALLGLATISKVTTGDYQGALTAYGLLVWMLYVFTHLGVAFVLAALIGTPGCEMRSFHHLWSLVSGNMTKEHVCPIGPLTPIDKWEAARGK